MQEDREHPFAAAVTRREGVAIIAVRGEVDLETAPRLREVIDAAIDGGARIEIDLRATTFIDSTGLAVLVDAYRRLGRVRDAVVVLRPQPKVQRVLEVSGVDRF